MQKTEEFQSGLTFRSILAIIFGIAVLLPTLLYINLVSGTIMAGVVPYITALLFSEILRFIGKPLSAPELYVIWTLILTSGFMPFLDLIYRHYFVSSPIIQSFRTLEGSPLPQVIPVWWAPPYGSSAYLVRTFFHQDWVLPILIMIVFFLLWIVQEVALAQICAVMYIEVEKLPFPFAPMSAEMIKALTERDSAKIHAFVITIVIGAIYGFIAYGFPLIFQGIFGIYIWLIPIPWIDLTSGFWGIEKIFPGALFGLSTDILTYALGFLPPIHVVTYMFIGSMACWVFGNWYTLNFLSTLFPEWAKEWSRGSSFSLVYQRSFMRVWVAPFFIFTLLTAIISLVKGRQYMIKTFQNLLKFLEKAKIIGYLPLPILLALYLLGTGISVLLFHYLVPNFPIWVALVVSVGGSFLNATISSRAVGETGYSITVPYLWHGAIILSGYKGIEPWLISPVFSTGQAASWVNAIKVGYLTGAKPSTFFKAYLLATALSFIFSFIYVSFFWTISPIPSSLYRAVEIYWPVNVVNSCMWISGQIFAFRPQVLINSSIIFLLIFAFGEIFSRITKIPFSLISLVTGFTMLPPVSIALFVGGLLGRILMEKHFGRERWATLKPIIVTGIAVGEGISVGVCSALVMIIKSAWILPW
ncbi:MAG: hypothetical protein QXK89_10585 [Candidatus Bathyarchaeia archaeon]